MSTAINAAIAAAQNAAASMAAAPTSGNVVPFQAPNAAVPAPVTRGTPMTLADFSTGGMNVDAYLKVKEHGLLVGDSNDLLSEVIVDIDLNEIQVCEVIKYGNPAVYIKTYDGVLAANGGSWAAAQEKARAVQADARPYKSADIPMTLTYDAKSMKGSTVLEAGKRIGHSLSTTNRGNFQVFLKDVQDNGLDGGTVRVKLTAEGRTNKAGNRWGVVKFELIPDAA